MTIREHYRVGIHDVEIAQRLLGPEDFGNSAPKNCLEHLAMIVKRVAVCILRVFNYLFGDHQWYDNETARQIIRLYLEELDQYNDAALSSRVHHLYQELELRANGNVSCTESLNGEALDGHLFPRQDLSLIGEARQDESGGRADQVFEASSMVLASLPTEIRLEIFNKLDAESLRRAFLLNRQTYEFITGEERLYHGLQLDSAIQKMLRFTIGIEEYSNRNQALFMLVKAQAMINPEQALQMMDHMEDLYYKRLAVLEVAKAYANVNPMRAIALMELYEGDNDTAFAELAIVQCAEQPEEALATVSRVQQDYYKASALLKMALKQSLISSDQADEFFRLAAETAGLIPSAGTKAALFSEIAQGWGSVNIDKAKHLFQQAESLASTMPPSDCLNTRVRTVENISLAQALINPEGARTTADSIGDAYRKAQTLYEIAKAQASDMPEEALVTARLIQVSYFKAEALCAIVKAQMSRHPGQVHESLEGLLQEASDAANAILNEPHWTTTAKQHWKAIALCHIDTARALMHPNDPLVLTDFTHNDVSASKKLNAEKARALSEIAQVRALTHAEQALAIAGAISLPDVQFETYSKIAKVQAVNDEEQALTTVRLIQDSLLQGKALCDVAKVVWQRDKSKAYEIFFQALAIACNRNEFQFEYFQLLNEIVEAVS